MAESTRGRKRTRFDGKNVGVWLPLDTIETIDRLAESGAITRGAVIVEAVATLAATPTDVARREIAVKKLELIKNLVND